MNKLSIIMPFVNEWPAISFTIRTVAEQLIDRIDFEIIAIDNYCDEVKAQQRLPDRGHANDKGQKSHIQEVSEKHSWLTYLKYSEKLSHWNSKNFGVQNSTGNVLLFLDAHVSPSRGYLYSMYRHYSQNVESLNGSLHSVLAYHILEDKRLIYSLKHDQTKGFLDYRFSSYPYHESFKDVESFEVPCMSTCGMMISKELYNKLKGWPKSLGIYGGGENYFNFVSAVLGIKKHIYNGHRGTLYHHGDKRGYSWNYRDYHLNKLIATYLFGGIKWAQRYKKYCIKGDGAIIDDMYSIAIEKNKERRNYIKENQIMSIEDWLNQWI